MIVLSSLYKGIVRFGDYLVFGLEVFLTSWKRFRIRRQKARKKRHWLFNLIFDDLLITIIIVIIIQQYFVQLYVVPSGSMENTILIKDRVIADNFSYGPEMLPGLGKLKGIRIPTKGDIIIFPNPEIPEKSPGWQLLRKFVFFITFSFVDLDKGKNGKPAETLLVKRAVGTGGEYLKFVLGNLYIKEPGSAYFQKEINTEKERGLHYKTKRLYSPNDYENFKILGEGMAFKKENIPVENWTFYPSEAGLNQINSLVSQKVYLVDIDYYTEKMENFLNPVAGKPIEQFEKLNLGYYVPKGYIMPLGDNRDNSEDGRYFGVVKQNRILGRVVFRLWPFNRIGIPG